jgi:hypothetical protein
VNLTTKPMKLTDVGSDDATVERYITDPDWVMQQKLDGARMMVLFENGEFLFTNDGVKPIKFAAALQKLPALEESLRRDFESLGVQQVILDGELIIETGVYHVWDVVVLRMDSTRYSDPDFNTNLVDGSERWDVRTGQMRIYLSSIQGPLVKLSRTAWTEGQKRLMWSQIKETNVEGAVSKLITSTYDEGERTKDWVKHKLVKTADVIVTSVQRTFKPGTQVVSHGTATLAVTINSADDPLPWVHPITEKRYSVTDRTTMSRARREGLVLQARSVLPIGNASLIGRDLTIDVGDVVEVNYLYFDRAMIQPRITRKRWDKQPDECLMEQFPAYSRVTV